MITETIAAKLKNLIITLKDVETGISAQLPVDSAALAEVQQLLANAEELSQALIALKRRPGLVQLIEQTPP